ncbi:MAG: hypothetical protein L6R28_14740 [Planctomycetes bacterium]|nr:hypothetical protein [Planctomycetota bacterium]
MRTMAIAVLLAGLAMGGTALQASEGYQDVVKLAQAGLGEEVLLAFVNSSNVPYDLTVDEIVRLNDLGVTDAVIQQIILVGKERRDAIAAGAAPNDQAPAPADEGPLMTPRDGALEPVDAAQPAAYEPEPTYSYAPPEENLDTSFFYESLTPYGTWYREPDYGWVWQPTVAVTSVSWRPYCDRGRWIWTDHGWYWHSYYSWGWAPFHYGRWVHTSHRRWCWVPDTVWAPAWVHWRSCDSHYGWAPLPPHAHYRPGVGFTWYGKHVSFSFNFGLGHDHYSFVPCNRFLAHDLAPVTVVNNTQIVNIYNNSTIVKDGYKTDKSRYINRGIAVDKVEKTNDIKKIETVEIAENNVKTGEPIKSDLRDGKKLVVYRPTIKEKVREEPPTIAERRKVQLEKQRKTQAQKEADAAKTGDAGESGKRPIRNLPGRRDVNKTEGNEANEATETATPAKTESAGKPEKGGKAGQAEDDARGGKTGRADLAGDDGPGKSDAAKQSIEDRRRAAEELRQKALAAYEAQKKNIEEKRKANEAQKAQDAKETRDVYDPQKGRIIRGRATPATPATPAQPSDSGASKATPATPAQPASQWPYNPGTSTQPGTKGASAQPATPAQPADGSGKVYDPRTGRTTRGSESGSDSGRSSQGSSSSSSSAGGQSEQNTKGGSSTPNPRGGRTTRGSEENAPSAEQPKAPARQGRTKKIEPPSEESNTEK